MLTELVWKIGGIGAIEKAPFQLCRDIQTSSRIKQVSRTNRSGQSFTMPRKRERSSRQNGVCIIRA
jgi:hypothetical protein